MNRIIVDISYTGNNYCACLPLLQGCFTVSDELEEIFAHIQESVSFHLEGMAEDGDEIPWEFLSDFSYEYHLSHSALIHWLGHYLSEEGFRLLFSMEREEIGEIEANRASIPEEKMDHFNAVVRKYLSHLPFLKIAHSAMG